MTGAFKELVAGDVDIVTGCRMTTFERIQVLVVLISLLDNKWVMTFSHFSFLTTGCHVK